MKKTKSKKRALSTMEKRNAKLSSELRRARAHATRLAERLLAAPPPAPPEFTVKFDLASTVPGKVADAELHFLSGVLAGFKLVGFAIWKRDDGSGFNATLPARPFMSGGARRSFVLLRPIGPVEPGAADMNDRIKTLVLEAYAAFQAANGRPVDVTPRSLGHFYLGIREDGTREVFSATKTPERAAYPQYAHMIGPFRTEQGANYMALHGGATSRCQTVADAEQLAAQDAQKGGAA